MSLSLIRDSNLKRYAWQVFSLKLSFAFVVFCPAEIFNFNLVKSILIFYNLGLFLLNSEVLQLV